MSTHANRVKMTVTSVASAGTGDITLNAASSGFRSFATAYGANATVDILITEGTAWEIARNCTYTHSGTTVSRGTLENSSTGSAVAFTSAAVVSVIATADAGRRWDSAGLQTVASSADAAVTGVVGALHSLDISGFSANRAFTLPATAAVDDRVGVYISTGDNTYILTITAASGDTLDNVAGGTTRTCLVRTGEIMIFRCLVGGATVTWATDYDGRLDVGFSLCADGTNQQTLTGGGVTNPITGSTGALRSVLHNYSPWLNTTTAIFNPKRAGRWQFSLSAVIDNMGDGKLVAIYLSHATGGAFSQSDDKSGIAWRGMASLTGTTSSIGGSGSIAVMSNGTTDQWEMDVYNDSAASPMLPGVSTVRGWARFSAEWLGDE